MPDEKEPVSLKTVVAGIIRALTEARRLGDIESAKLFEAYKKEETLSLFAVPSFTISDAEIDLRFSIVAPSEEKMGEGEIADLKVNISPESLKGLEIHQVSAMKMKISSSSIGVLGGSH